MDRVVPLLRIYKLLGWRANAYAPGTASQGRDAGGRAASLAFSTRHLRGPASQPRAPRAGRARPQDAFKCYVRTRDYCTTPRHVLAMCLNVIRCAVEMGNFLHVANYVNKAEATPEAKVGAWGASCVCMCVRAARRLLCSGLRSRQGYTRRRTSPRAPTDPPPKSPTNARPAQDDAPTSAKLRAAAGLALLDQRKYRQAARAFVEVSPELAYTYSEVRARARAHASGWTGSTCACRAAVPIRMSIMK